MRSHIMKSLTALLASLLVTPPALAQDTIDVGTLKNSEIQVVQKLLYPKAGAMEYGGVLGWMPFDAYTTTPVGGLTVAMHSSESLGYELSLMGGYAMKNQAMQTLEGPAYGVAPDAYGYVGSAIVDVQWSPIYAKLNWLGKRVYHHDVFLSGGLGATYEKAVLPDHDTAISPTLGLGIGARIFLGQRRALRFQLRDDLIREHREKTVESQAWFIKQNVSLLVGFTMFSKGS
jgi:outer membrane beta-barrel protein